MKTSPKTRSQAEFLERHYLVIELSEAWHLSVSTLRSWFIDEPGVIRIGEKKLRRGRKRIYISLRIPESVARRVYRKRTGCEAA